MTEDLRRKIDSWLFELDLVVGDVKARHPGMRSSLGELYRLLELARGDDEKLNTLFGVQRARGRPKDVRNERLWTILLSFISASRQRRPQDISGFLGLLQSLGEFGLQAQGEDIRVLEKRLAGHNGEPHFFLPGGIRQGHEWGGAAMHELDFVDVLQSWGETDLGLWSSWDDLDQLWWAHKPPASNWFLACDT